VIYAVRDSRIQSFAELGFLLILGAIVDKNLAQSGKKRRGARTML
jgi:hypothetical protein